MESLPLTIWNHSEVFKENEISNFRIQLNQPLEFHPSQGQWEVALAEITYPRSRQIFVDNSDITISSDSRTLLRTREYYDIHYTKNIKIKGGYFLSHQSLIEHIQNTVINAFLEYYVEYPSRYHSDPGRGTYSGFQWEIPYIENKYILRVIRPSVENYLTQRRRGSLIINSGLQMWNLLGFTNFKLNEKMWLGLLEADNEPEFVQDYAGFYILAPNLIDSSAVGFGESRAPILAYVPYLANKAEDQITIRFVHPLYLPVFGGYINNIQIYIQDMQLKPIYFESETVKLVLHFRRSKPQ